MKKQLIHCLMIIHLGMCAAGMLCLPGCGGGDEPTGDAPTEETPTPEYIQGEKAANRRQ